MGTLPYRQGALVGSTMEQPLTVVSDNSSMYVYFSMNESRLLDLLQRYGSAEKAIKGMPDISLYLSNGSLYRDIQQIARTSFLPWCQVLLPCSELKKKLTIVAISMRFVRMRSRRLVGCMFVRPMPSCKSGIFMRCSVFPVASLLSFSYAPPG